MASNKRPDQQQIADVGAGDEQDKCDHGNHNLESGQQFAGMVEWGLPQRPQPHAAPTVGGRIARLQSCRHGGDLLLCLWLTDAGFQAHIGFDPSRTAVLELVTSPIEGFLHRYWHPKLDRPAYEGPIESLWCHANDGVGHIVQALRLADDLPVAFKAIAPQLIADNYNGMGIVSYVLARFETTPENRTSLLSVGSGTAMYLPGAIDGRVMAMGAGDGRRHLPGGYAHHWPGSGIADASPGPGWSTESRVRGRGWASVERLDSIGFGHFPSVFEFHFASRGGSVARKPAENSNY